MKIVMILNDLTISNKEIATLQDSPKFIKSFDFYLRMYANSIFNNHILTLIWKILLYLRTVFPAFYQKENEATFTFHNE